MLGAVQWPFLPDPDSSPLSSSSTPFSVGAQPVSPESPTLANLTPDQVPFTVTITDDHPYGCQVCEKAFEKSSYLHKHEQVSGEYHAT